MSAGLIFKTVSDGLGGSFIAAFWSSNGLDTGHLFPASVGVDGAGALGTAFSLTGTLPAFAATPAFTISGTLPAFAATPTVNLGTIGAVATAANQTAIQGTFGAITANKTVLYDASGVAIDFTAASPVTQSGTWTNLVKGTIASGATASDAPVVTGARAATANPTAVTDGQVVAFRADKTGRLITSPHQARDLQGDATLTLTSTTTATTLVAAGGAGVFRDLLSLTLTNIHATTGSEVQILDDDGTTVRWVGFAPASQMTGIVFPVPLKQASANTTWKAKTVTSVASVKITAQYATNT